MSGMWFLLGVLGGCAVGLGVWRFGRRADVEKAEPSASVTPKTTKEWVETRNFLYYDGTVMPEIKEDSNEQ